MFSVLAPRWSTLVAVIHSTLLAPRCSCSCKLEITELEKALAEARTTDLDHKVRLAPQWLLAVSLSPLCDLALLGTLWRLCGPGRVTLVRERVVSTPSELTPKVAVATPKHLRELGLLK
eukprot:801412-Amphidinium_carterae.1